MEPREVYVVMLFSSEDTFWYVLDLCNWNKLNWDRDLCMQIDDVGHLNTPSSLKELFELLKDNNWTVADSAEGVMY